MFVFFALTLNERLKTFFMRQHSPCQISAPTQIVVSCIL